MNTMLRDWIGWHAGYAYSRSMTTNSVTAHTRWRLWNAINRCVNGEDW